jgi:hypothetical protein
MLAICPALQVLRHSSKSVAARTPLRSRCGIVSPRRNAMPPAYRREERAIMIDPTRQPQTRKAEVYLGWEQPAWVAGARRYDMAGAIDYNTPHHQLQSYTRIPSLPSRTCARRPLFHLMLDTNAHARITASYLCTGHPHRTNSTNYSSPVIISPAFRVVISSSSLTLRRAASSPSPAI